MESHNGTADTQADFQFLLPLEQGQSVLVIGDAPNLAQALQDNFELTTVKSFEDCDNLPQKHFDHIFIPQLENGKSGKLNDLLGKLLKTSGIACVGFRNKMALQQLRFWKRPKLSTNLAILSLTDCRKILNYDFDAYGVYKSLNQPGLFVPLFPAYIPGYFISHLMSPATMLTKITHQFMYFFIKLRLQHVLFQDIVIVTKLTKLSRGN